MEWKLIQSRTAKGNQYQEAIKICPWLRFDVFCVGDEKSTKTLAITTEMGCQLQVGREQMFNKQI
jgi:hypothetical protein